MKTMLEKVFVCLSMGHGLVLEVPSKGNPVPPLKPKA
jgi:hypothetical protein